MLVRSRITSGSACAALIRECYSYVERTVWDGDQVAFEIRAPGHSQTPSYSMVYDYGVYSGYEANAYGQTAYVHAGGIDQPIVVMRTGLNSSTPISVHPHQNWRGQFALGTKSDGTLLSATTGYPMIAWPGAAATVDGEVKRYDGDGPVWFGGLIPGKTDGSGMQYMRNRYYDPATGRFTQQDPIGLAGGVNVYGFASGDPVNHSDPFGLCVPPVTPACAYWVVTGIAAGLAAWQASTLTSDMTRPDDPTGMWSGDRAGRKFTPRDRREIMEGGRSEDGTIICTYCGGEAEHADHVIPKAQGGAGEKKNGVPACPKCNWDKGNRSPSQWIRRWYDKAFPPKGKEEPPENGKKV